MSSLLVASPWLYIPDSNTMIKIPPPHAVVEALAAAAEETTLLAIHRSWKAATRFASFFK
jgi:hypothetical protein